MHRNTKLRNTVLGIRMQKFVRFRTEFVYFIRVVKNVLFS